MSANPTLVPRRSVLFMPGSNTRALDKARGLAADGLIFDLEDAVAPDAKGAARDNIEAALTTGGYGDRELIVRANSLDTGWAADDIAMAVRAGATAVLLPKVDSIDDLEIATTMLNGAALSPRLWIMAETPLSILNIEALCGSGLADVVVVGTADLSKALRITETFDRQGLTAFMSQAVVAARAHGLDILDGVFGDLTDDAALREQCAQGRQLGFDGKTLIHPRQIDVANAVFGVSEAEVREAADIVSAWEAAEQSGRGVTVVNGKMIERLHADEARRRLALHAAQTARTQEL